MERKVYLLLTDTGTIFTRMIKLFTKKPYNHASISLDPQLAEVYSFGRKRQKNPFIGGFVMENIQTGLFKQAKCAIYSCSVSESQYQKMNQYIQKIEKQKHIYRYNLLGLFAIILNKKVNRENAFFCSQFVSTALEESGIFEFEKPPSLITPHDLHQVPQFILVYQGNLTDYLYQAGIERNEEMIPSQPDWMGILRRKLWSA